MGKKSVKDIIGILLIAVFVVSLISATALKLCSSQLGDLNWKTDQGSWRTLTAIGNKIEVGADPGVLQADLTELCLRDPKFGDLIIIKEDGTVVAAKNTDAVGKICLITSVTNIVNGLPIPFYRYNSGYKKNIATPKNYYSIDLKPKYMLNKFGEYRAPGGSLYCIYGTYKVDPGVITKLNSINRYGTVLFQAYRICFILFWLLLPVWVYMDARKSRNNAAAWGILTLFTNLIGWAVYLIARPQTMICPACALEQSANAKFCCSCGAAIKNCCPQCGTEINNRWLYCGECGRRLEE